MKFTSQPSYVIVGRKITPPVVFDFGNPKSVDVVTLSLNMGPGKLRGTLDKAAVKGIVTFDDLTIDAAGSNYRIAATTHNSPDILSDFFNVSP